MLRRNTSFLPITLVAVFLAPLFLLLSYPVLNAIHSRFSLPSPPFSGLLILGISLAVAFVGGALIGHFIGGFSLRSARRGLEIAAVFAAIVWGGFVAFSAAPVYAGDVIDRMTRDGSALVWQERTTLAARARDVADRVKKGESRQLAESAAREAWEKTKDLRLRGVAALPASLLLGWALVVPPFLGYAAFKRAARR